MKQRKFTTNSRVVTDLFAQYANTFNAFCELINNSIQAGAKNIEISIEYPDKNELTSLLVSKLEIKDDGQGVPVSEIDACLLNIGTNVKSGGKGIGRFSALQLGSTIEIESIAYEASHKKYSKFNFVVQEDFFSTKYNISDLDIPTQEEILEYETNPYYKVEIRNFYDSVVTENSTKKKISQEFLKGNLPKALFERYALKIFNKEITFVINSEKLEPETFLIGEPERIKTIFTDKKGKESDMFFSFFNVKLDKPKIQILLTVENAGIDSVVAGFEFDDSSLSPDLGSYFIYVKSPLFTIDKLRNLDLGDFDNDMKQIKDFIRDKVGNVLGTKDKIYDNFLEKLRKDKFNPLNNGHSVSGTKKSVFEKFAYLVEKEYHLLDKSNPIREILYSLIERSISNGDLRIILDKINRLDDNFVSRFRNLLEKVELESVLEFSEKVAKKLEDLSFLEKITCGDIAKCINERKDLHIWLVKMQMIWIFGEQYYDATKLLSDKNLENNLTELRNNVMSYSKQDDNDNYSAVDNAEIESITDLFLYSEKILDKDNREVIIVELKAPYVKISQKELQQVEKYAFEIGRKHFFPKNIKYNIILISSDFNELVRDKLSGTAEQNRNNPYFYWANKEGNIEISVVRWIGLLESNKRRLKYLSNELEIKDLTVKEKLEQEFGEEEYEKIKGRLTKIKV